MTSRYPHNCVSGHEVQLPSGQKTIAHVFNEHGYKTAYIGKWHLDGFHEREGRAAKHIIPPERRGGFQHWIGYENNNSQYDCWVHGDEGDNAFHYRLPGYETDELTNLLIDYIKQQGKAKNRGDEAPFFAVLSVQPPHDPYIAPEEMRKRHNPARIELRPNVPNIPRIIDQARKELSGYYAMIENLDWNVGRIRKALEACGLDGDTHLIFFSDHGDMHGSHGQFRKTIPFEESIRIPFIMGGEQLYHGRVRGTDTTPINHVDIAPTTLGLCGIEKPTWMEGTDYSSHRLRGNPKDNEPDSAYIQNINALGEVCRPWRGIVTKDGWKYVCYEGAEWMLYNLQEDPYEQVNLINFRSHQRKCKELNERLREWIKTTADSFTLPEYH
ncbi:sulfatase [Paenibacillus allorhizosphaerae]|uniref:Ulvan-active sulfatase n=1 Tax=Paenibacillus allorhizosphaerae TaxID=2849866 RepID=A0ABM8VQL0_9BACL|nr:sulfatase [Paenibacillus allorhizosphaerae]CAG7654319.1 Ulvan-active sulfatase [Paenibacillus allorhizosphaerae]